MSSPRPPSAVFEAVLLYGSKQDSLHEPLLQQDSKNETVKDDDTSLSSSSASLSASQTRYLHFLSFVTGSWMAVMSQLLLSQTMWMKDLVSSSTLHIVLFSLAWSFWTCVVVFCSMLLWGRLLERRLLHGDAKSNKLGYDTLLFQMEAHHIVGALLSISALWMTVDVLQASEWKAMTTIWTHFSGYDATPTPVYIVGCVSSIFLWYPFMLCVLPREYKNEENVATESTRSEGLLSTYHLIAVTLGLITGLCSQFVLSFVLWHQTWMSSVEQIVVFSLLWSLATVIWTAIGCSTLRWIVQDGDSTEVGMSAKEDSAERILFQMESRYIVGCLIGICTAWMVMDWVFQVREQILPCLLLLSLSLACFFVILACFPEEKCFVNLEAELEEKNSDNV